MLGPLPRWLTGCAYPFLPLPHRPSPKSQRVGCSTLFRSTTSEREVISRLQSFVDLQASEFAATQVVPTAGNQHGCQGGRGVYVRAERGSLPPRASDMLAVRNRAIDGRGLSPPRSAALLAAPGISPRGPHRTVREPLDSYGSCHPLKAAAFHRKPRAPPVSRWPMISMRVTPSLRSTGVTPLHHYYGAVRP